jgi:hypothetical protein
MMIAHKLTDLAASFAQSALYLHSSSLTRRTQSLAPRGPPLMPVDTKRVFYVEDLSPGIFAELSGARPDAPQPAAE